MENCRSTRPKNLWEKKREYDGEVLKLAGPGWRTRWITTRMFPILGTGNFSNRPGSTLGARNDHGFMDVQCQPFLEIIVDLRSSFLYITPVLLFRHDFSTRSTIQDQSQFMTRSCTLFTSLPSTPTITSSVRTIQSISCINVDFFISDYLDLLHSSLATRSLAHKCPIWIITSCPPHLVFNSVTLQ